MEQHTLVRDPTVDVLHRYRTRGSSSGHRGLAQPGGSDAATAAGTAPDLDEMALARAGRAANGQRLLRPAGPGIDGLDSGGVDGAHQEILPAQCRAIIEIERQLPRPSGHVGVFPKPPAPAP